MQHPTRIHLTLAALEGALLRCIGTIGRRGWTISRLRMDPESDATLALTVELTRPGRTSTADVKTLLRQLSGLYEVRIARGPAARLDRAVPPNARSKELRP